ncbi:2,3-bisphosphoglycerate-independent phosphoglycerate mutase [Cocleimonas flava]|uniref:2,3-bisphosphoglycerate-independent phosphoglycerate mutase n=1 Tax=Cocleimonas flava TaxID=634765 RepID=A0A4R1F9Q6_9GAMM|nr:MULTISPECIES: 2,3-bisphosphoglycerate-independent phosphoglycerate mutase [Cocleimonas]MEB8430912.1 2,3-bisphosphoglycerate-independent phosphoglycerate mutase [Cocleimonas sp. KMM 6892]MEC4714316.1 2,3-bisphosphoglycerate-independent phosphoglycerate mutase [Cocleimonas sp. KMM 6895]MEC4743647.1 2,3-bisphosphoglycerate-independent phosphoglycerate mutase [Cocleimonas sp. KMM 6896]TCJ88608.1 phosphoglycerate mutase [Cocleimonas flava]
MTTKSAPRRKTMLVIMDGFGVNPSKKNNAVYEANTPNLDEYFGKYPHTTLEASGNAVGLPDGQMGNSEVGHLTIGCGIIIKQNLVRVDDAIEDGSLAQNPTLLETIASAKARNRPLHLIGLVSDGGVHSHVSHLCALIKICNDNQVKPVIHAITDGRDTSPKSAKKYLQQMVDTLEEFGGSVATVSGRYYAMDRDNRWDRTQIAWEAMVNGKGESASDVLQAIDDAYANGENDEFVIPRVMPNAEKIEADDAVLFFNFRNDRPRQMTAALSMTDFDGFDRGDYSPVVVTTMTEYEKKFNAPVIFPPERPATNLADTISQAGLKQLHCSETEKYAHVTFFLNGGKEQPYEGEDRILIESPKVNTYDECPEMSAKEVADEIIKAANAGEHDFIVVNFANGDMVGHTAIPEPIIRAVEALDREVGRVLDAAVANDYSVIVTADHGNCDEYIDPYSGEPNTQHTVYPVPCLVIDKSFWKLSTGAGLSNIAPTVMQLMGIEQPKEIMSKSILLEEMTEDSKPAAY